MVSTLLEIPSAISAATGYYNLVSKQANTLLFMSFAGMNLLQYNISYYFIDPMNKY